jgi:hypothetical protein
MYTKCPPITVITISLKKMHRYFDLYAHVQEKKTPGVFFSITCGPILDPFYPSEPSLGPTAKPPSRLYAAINITVYSSIYGVYIWCGSPTC